MKRILCLVLCLMLVIPAAMADTADTLPKLFARQLSGGNGMRGYISISAFGRADWLTALLPFTGTDIQIRAIGEKQGDMSESIMDDDDWQIKLYAENSAEQEVGTTWLYGNPDGVYFQSELLPDTVLTFPVENTHLLYQFFRGDWNDLFFAFDPMNMKAPGANGNASSYEAVANVLGVPAEEWETAWLPVLEKYFLQLDLWLAGYGDPSFVTGEETGSLKMTANYNIPAEDFKAEAKYLIGQMIYDHDLQNLLLPYVTMETRMTYLNPSMVYFYEACIDALDLQGDIILSREMSALGEVMSTTVSLPVPALPKSLTAPIDDAASAIFALENMDVFSGVNRLVLSQSGNEKSVTLSGDVRTIIISTVESKADENTTAWEGTLKMIPNAGVEETALSASFSGSYGHKIWQDEKYLDHDTTEVSFAIEPDLANLDADDPFRNSYIDFKPVQLDLSVDYRNNPHQANSAVQINIDANAQLPDAQVEVAAILRIATQMQMENLPTAGAENFMQMTDERKAELAEMLIDNAVKIMANLHADSLEEVQQVAEPLPEATMVPPVTAPTNE